MSVRDGLDFDQFKLQEVNLFVGISGSGKSKLLDSIFDAARFAIGSEGKTLPFLPLLGSWIIEVEIVSKHYKWECERDINEEGRNIIKKERIEVTDENTNKIVLVDRTNDVFNFHSKILPKLDVSRSCIELLQDEAEINPIFLGFTNVLRRNFSRDEISKASAYVGVDKSYDDLFTKKTTLPKAMYSLFNLPLSIRLYYISQHLKKEFKAIVDSFKQLFPTIEDCAIVDANKEKLTVTPGLHTPAFMVTEKGISKKIELKNLSSGMVKVLLILTDILTMPDGFIYELDEYENSLGINVINFLPSLLLEHQKSKQFLISTHHPYLINKMPVSHWYVLSRDGYKVKIKYGDELVKKYGKSSQESFIKLINDPFYSPENK